MSDKSVQCSDVADFSCQTNSSFDLVLELCVLGNKLLHAAYWYLLLEVVLSKDDPLTGLTRELRERGEASRKSAREIFSWLLNNKEMLRLTDIARPDIERLGVSNNYAVRMMALLDKWIEDGVKYIMMSIVDEDLEEILRKMLDRHRSLALDSQDMKRLDI